ncbi:MAG: divergent polysaccharide deacetylase family protein [Alphaproteobacteria bacterium]
MSNWPKGIDPGLVLTCIFVGFLLYWFLPTNHARVLPPRVVTKPHADYDDVDEIDESMTDKPAASPAGDSSRSWVPFAPSQPSVPEVDQPQKISPQQREKRSELAPGQLPRIAVVIDDLGLNERATKAAIALPAAVTLSFLPYGEHATALAGAARAQGHELLLHMPMQPVGHDDPGPGALTVDLKEDEIAARVRKAFEAIPEAIGVNNHMGSRFNREWRKARAGDAGSQGAASVFPRFQDIAAFGRGRGRFGSRRAGAGAGHFSR